MQIHTPGTSCTTRYQNPLVVFCKKGSREQTIQLLIMILHKAKDLDVNANRKLKLLHTVTLLLRVSVRTLWKRKRKLATESYTVT